MQRKEFLDVLIMEGRQKGIRNGEDLGLEQDDRERRHGGEGGPEGQPGPAEEARAAPAQPPGGQLREEFSRPPPSHRVERVVHLQP